MSRAVYSRAKSDQASSDGGRVERSLSRVGGKPDISRLRSMLRRLTDRSKIERRSHSAIQFSFFCSESRQCEVLTHGDSYVSSAEPSLSLHARSGRAKRGLRLSASSRAKYRFGTLNGCVRHQSERFRNRAPIPRGGRRIRSLGCRERGQEEKRSGKEKAGTLADACLPHLRCRRPDQRSAGTRE